MADRPEAVLPAQRISTQRKQTLWISAVLLGGVLLAALLILLGLLRLLLGPMQPGEPATVTELIGQQAHPTSLTAILDGIQTGRPTSLIRLGILVLILTPTMRVLLTWLLFLHERDWTFVLITSVVLAVLVLGLLGLTG
jgi:uncharacterized membrane protein